MKIRTFFRRRPFLLSTMLITLLLFSCSGDKSTDTGDDGGPDRTTPDGLLEVFATSYAEKNLDDYDMCLDESFLFIFTDDIADSLGLPQSKPWWGKTADLNSTRMMFEDTHVENITFTYEYVGEWDSYIVVREDTTFSGLFRVIDPVIEVVTVIGGSEDPELKYRVDGSFLEVVVVPDRFRRDLWCILSIEEIRKIHLKASLASANTATEGSTWGGIKGMWH